MNSPISILHSYNVEVLEGFSEIVSSAYLSVFICKIFRINIYKAGWDLNFYNYNFGVGSDATAT